jgi:hypothetical protein
MSARPSSRKRRRAAGLGARARRLAARRRVAIEGPCPFCGGRWRADRLSRAGELVSLRMGHTAPPCREFGELAPEAFLKAAHGEPAVGRGD